MTHSGSLNNRAGEVERCSTMGWETRGGRTYYYQKHRIGGRVVSEYVGGGEFSQLVAEVDALDRAERQERRAQFLADRQRQKELDAQVDQACAACSEAIAAALEAAGFHRHKGQWRRRNA